MLPHMEYATFVVVLTRQRPTTHLETSAKIVELMETKKLFEAAKQAWLRIPSESY